MTKLQNLEAELQFLTSAIELINTKLISTSYWLYESIPAIIVATTFFGIYKFREILFDPSPIKLTIQQWIGLVGILVVMLVPISLSLILTKGESQVILLSKIISATSKDTVEKTVHRVFGDPASVSYFSFESVRANTIKNLRKQKGKVESEIKAIKKEAAAGLADYQKLKDQELMELRKELISSNN